MISNKSKVKKKGNVIVVLGIIIMIIVIVAGFFVTYQLNIIISSVKKDLFYISNNALVAMDFTELSYGVYKINMDRTKEIMEELLNKNKHIGINKVTIKEIELMYKLGEPHILSKIQVDFTPVINIGNKTSYTFELQENVAISLLQYGGGYE